MKKILLLFGLITCLSGAQAAVFNIANGDVAALIAAINTANGNTEADVINLATNGTYNLTAVNNTIVNPNIGGGNGLPAITNSFAGVGPDVTINGNGATIQRNMASDLRILVIAGSGTEVVINDVIFKNAKATLNGACIAAMWQKVKITINGCTFENNVLTPTGANTEDGGGAILIHEGFLTVNNSTFRGNSAPNGGGIKCLLSNMTLTNCTFENNATTGTGNNGGAGVIVDGAFNDFSNPNTYNPARSIIIQQCKFLTNTDIKQGGGLFLFTYGITNVTIDQSYFKGNTSPSGAGMHFGSDGSAGAICTVTNSTFDSNISSGDGGGINYYSPNSNPTLNLTNCTIAFNIANGVGGSGGGIAVFGNPKLVVNNCTIAGNFTRGWGGGIANGTTTIRNSIIANNLATNANNLYNTNNQQQNCAGGNGFNAASPPSPYHSGGNNLEFPIRTSPGAGGLMNNALCAATTLEADPKLDNAVKDNGGIVPTLAILAGSAAINAGSSCTTTLDQRGTARTGACDIGAFEFGAPTASNVYYVSLTGNNANAGTKIAPWRTMVYSAAQLKAGDTLRVMPGTYNEIAKVAIYAGNIAFKADTPNNRPTIDFNDRNNAVGRYVDGYGYSNVSWDGINITNAGGGDRAAINFGIWYPTGWTGTHLQNWTIKNCDISYAYNAAVRWMNVDNVLIENVYATECAQLNANGLDLLGHPHIILGFFSNSVTVRNCRIIRNYGEGVGPYVGCANWLIENNTVADNFTVNVYVDTEVGNCIVRNNLIYNTTFNSGQIPCGIRIANEVSDLPYGYQDPSKFLVSNVEIYNNIILNVKRGIEAFPYWDGPFQLTNSVISNNTIATTTGNSRGLFLTVPGSYQVRNNIVYNTTGITLGPAATASNNYTSDPIFVNGTGINPANYMLAAGSPCIDTGIAVASVTTDFGGTARPYNSTYDIGAYEFNGPVVLPPPLPAATGSAVAISCSDTEASLIAKNTTKLTLGGSTYYIGYRQVSADNQNPVVIKFTAGVRNWCREDYEITGDDGKGYGLFWNGQSLYAVFTATGTQGTVAQDYRRFTGSGWLKTYSDGSPGGGGGPKVAILLKISRATGEGQVGQGTFITSRLASSGKTNSLEIKDLYMNTDGHLVVRANAWFAPRNVNKTPLFQTPATGGSPHDYTLILTQNLTTAICASAVNWNNVSASVNTPCNATPAAGVNIVSLSKLAFCAGNADNFQISFALGADIPLGTNIQAELSDAAGNFAGNLIGSATVSPLTAALPGSLPTGSYRVRLVAATVPAQPGAPFADQIVIANAAIWSGAVNTDWDEAGNWSCQVPNASTDAVIPSGPANLPSVNSANPVCRNLTIQAGAKIEGPGTLQVKGTWNNFGAFNAVAGTVIFSGGTAQEIKGGGTFFNLVVDNPQGASLGGPTNVQNILTLRNGDLVANGQLVLVSGPALTAMVVNQNGAVLGNATMQRYVDAHSPRASGLGYNYLSSPMGNARVSELADDFPLVLNGAYDWVTNPSSLPFPNFYRYRENKVNSSPANFDQFERGWESPANSSEVLVPTVGYIANIAPEITLDIRGTLNTGNLTRKVARGNGINSGWALLGNPYPAPIDWDKVWDANPFLLGTAQRRIATGQFAGTWAYYVANTPLGTGTNGATKHIAIMQGFFARVGSPGEFDLVMDNPMRLTDNPNPRFFRPEIDNEEYSDGLIKLRLAGQGQSLADETIVYFRQGATAGLDRAYDAPKNQLNAAPAPNLVSAGQGTRLAVNALPELVAEVVVPLHFAVSSAGPYSLSPELLALFKGKAKVMLEDRRLNTRHDLYQGAYTFTASAGADTARFFLRISPDLAALQANQLAGLHVYPNPAREQLTLRLTGESRGEARVTLTDPAGRTVRQFATEKPRDLAERQLDVASLPPGLYLLSVQTNTGTYTKKFVKE